MGRGRTHLREVGHTLLAESCCGSQDGCRRKGEQVGTWEDGRTCVRVTMYCRRNAVVARRAAVGAAASGLTCGRTYLCVERPRITGGSLLWLAWRLSVQGRAGLHVDGRTCVKAATYCRRNPVVACVTATGATASGLTRGGARFRAGGHVLPAECYCRRASWVPSWLRAG